MNPLNPISHCARACFGIRESHLEDEAKPRVKLRVQEDFGAMPSFPSALCLGKRQPWAALGTCTESRV